MKSEMNPRSGNPLGLLFPAGLCSFSGDFLAFFSSAFFSRQSLRARAAPPFKPPRRPRATAAGSLPLSSGGGATASSASPTDKATISRPNWFASVCLFGLLERLGIAGYRHLGDGLSIGSNFKMRHYRMFEAWAQLRPTRRSPVLRQHHAGQIERAADENAGRAFGGAGAGPCADLHHRIQQIIRR